MNTTIKVFITFCDVMLPIESSPLNLSIIFSPLLLLLTRFVKEQHAIWHLYPVQTPIYSFLFLIERKKALNSERTKLVFNCAFTFK